MYMKICLVGDVLDVISCANFQNEIVRGYDFTGGQIFHFLLICERIFNGATLLRCLWYHNR